MSDNEYERFEITDYDLENEFNVNRPRRRQTKNQQIYGIWADDSDDSGGESNVKRRGRRGGHGASTKSKNYSAPVSFVAGGIQQVGKKKKEKLKETEEDEESRRAAITDEEDEIAEHGDDDVPDVRPSFGRKQHALLDVDTPYSSEDSSEQEEVAERPMRGEASGSNSRAQSMGAAKSKMLFTQRPTAAAPPFTGKKGDGNVGAWEQHTRGIGAKLLMQMGYEPGKGLGKDLQGIAQPVEAHVRKGRGAIGAYGPEKKTTVKGQPQKGIEDEDVREAKEFKENLNKWKKSDDMRQNKPKRYYYRSVEEIIEKGKSGTHQLSEKISRNLGNVPVIDMTGPERRVLSGYHALSQAKVGDEDLYEFGAATTKKGATTAAAAATTLSVGFALPELMHNLQLIVNLCEQEIITLDNAHRDASDRQDALEHERKNLEEVVKLEQDHIDTLERALQLVEELTEGGEHLTLERAEKVFAELQCDLTAEYQEFALGDLAAGVIAPLVKSALETWQPLVEPTQHVDMVKKWRAILEPNGGVQDGGSVRNIFDPYSSLIWAGVMPSFRACATTWNPKQHQAMAALLDCWAPLFPTWILDSVLEQLVLPRLNSGVREWDPLTDTVPIHIWILPWNLILGHKMEEFIFPTIREKLGVALQAWMPQDRSARAMLTPWKGAFSDAEMQMFLLQHIIPKLQMVLNELIINPLQQDLELWNQVWEWHELIPALLMGQLLDKYFFPKWMQVLVMWLNQSPDYAEISRWYCGWKGMLNEELLREPNIKEHLRRALEIMHRATTDTSGMASVPPILVTAGTAAAAAGISTPLSTVTPSPPQPPPLPLMDLQFMAPAQLEFKELVSQKCAERGILFAPLPGRRELGKQVYRVGKLYCYIDRNVCMLCDSSFKNWLPASLGQLLERAVTGVI